MDETACIGGLTLSADVRPAAWIGTDPAARGLAAYARVLHPAVTWVDDREQDVRWARVAAATGHTLDATTSWEAVARAWHPHGQPGVWEDEPIEGQPPVGHAARLVSLLAAHTGTPDRCWYAVWNGYGALALPRVGVPMAKIAGRSMLVLSGPLSSALTSLETAPFDRRANLWWPDDRAWLVATDVEATSTYVGGSAECIAAVRADDLLEVF